MKTSHYDYAAYIGLDWADTKHDICLKVSGEKTLEYTTIEHTPEAIEEWVLSLQERFNNQPIAICLELKTGPIVYALLKYAFITLFPIAPSALAKYREVFTQSGAKDDPSDAYLQLDYLLRHPESLNPLHPDSAETRTLQRLVEDRRTLVGDKVRLTNRITAALKSYFPQALQWFDDIDTPLFCDFILKWPTLDSVQRARVSTIESFFKTHNCVKPSVIKRRVEAIRAALPLTEDQGVIVPMQRMCCALAKHLKCLLETLHEYDLEIAQRFRAHADHDLFDSLPGAGPVFGPRLLAAFGSDRKRFSDSDEVARLGGIAPVVERSGKRTWVHWRYSCPTFMRQTFVEWANQSIRYSFWAREFYEKKRAQGKSHQATLRALSFKWLRILFRCWQDKVVYDESVYLFALKRRKAEV